jgi:hypothetical protein
VEITIDGEQVFVQGLDDSLCGAEEYTEQTVDISAFADGLSHTLELHSETFAAHGSYSNIFVDSVSITACGTGAGGGGVGGGGTGGGGCYEVVPDGSFEEGTPNDFWEEDSTNFETPLCDSTCDHEGQNSAHDGDWWAWFGGIDRVEEGSLRTQVALPPTATTLTFQLQMPRCDGYR